ncbi:5' nucleotidase, NT5C type [Clostridium formicaceticum]|uniref:Nucleotidase n=1 Tax=Clostridium formicaceticum TaxID=1497 RepID=A0AAC9RM02_9CLOT|nr:hypothetical protein [Clostridium formicaceticum]AOY77474.1 hypothetical protein BJL90_17405 [Clostridium formicaceticum]ARE88037.1 5' nucleotidase, deoxy (Pyrimidine), cytosolic type C protein (NT5C) [Clostridium formicaceticum]
MKHLNLCIDIDGTITEAYDWIPRANDYFSRKIAPKDVKVYEIHEVLGVSRKAYDEFYTLYGEVLHEEAKIREGVKTIVNELYKQHKIHFVTAREEKMKDVTNRWFIHHQISSHSLSLLGSHNKVTKAQELACDIFIEDRYENAMQLSLAGFEVLLMDCHYNQGILPPKVTRVNNWYEISDIIEKRLHKLYPLFKIAT